MASDPDNKPDVAAIVETVKGSTVSNDGHRIKVEVVIDEEVTAHLIMSPDCAVDLIAAAAIALGQATRIRTADPGKRFTMPAEHWTIEPVRDPHKLQVSFVMPGGGELCFEVDRADAQVMHETLGVLLGAVTPSPIPKTQRH